MKISLTVTTAGKMQGKSIPITLSQFLIGRDPHCQLRPANPMISNRHCAILTRGKQVLLRDFESTNGTFVNDERLIGERELQTGDSIRIGPLAFQVNIERPVPVDEPTPYPGGDVADDEAAAHLLMSLQDGQPPSDRSVDDAGIPTGTTVMEAAPLPDAADSQSKEEKDKKPNGGTPKPKNQGDTSTAANSILQKYLRRPRT
jgi:pSer/pThr/pTyr-binding forkhead associated (FHA) protein